MLMTQVNRVIRSLDVAGINSTACEQIKNIDVDPRLGAISIAAAYESFQGARRLLEKEASEYIKMVDQQISHALKIKSLAEFSRTKEILFQIGLIEKFCLV